MSAWFVQCRRDLLVAARGRAAAVQPLAFFVLGTLVLGLGTGAQALPLLAPGVVWVLALFASMLAVDGVFAADHDDGTLDQLLMHGRPLFAAVLGKLAAHWVATGLPVAVLGPLAAYMLGGSLTGAGVLAASLLLGTPALTLIAAIGAALTVGLGRGGLLLAVLVMPLCIPVLVFGAGAGMAAAAGDDPANALRWLAALLAASVTAAPFAVGKALAISQEY